MKFVQVKKDVFYGSEKNHSFWITKEADKYTASMWMISPTPSSEPINSIEFDTIQEAEEYLNGLSATLYVKVKEPNVAKPIPNIKDAFENLLSHARMSMIRDGSGRGSLKIEVNINVAENPLDRFIYDYKHTLDNANAGLQERDEYLRLKEKYEGIPAPHVTGWYQGKQA
jgi:hypothetical protein